MSIRVQTISAPAALAATTNGAAVNIVEFQGVCQVVLTTSATGGSGQTSTVKIQHSDDGSTGWTDTGLAFAATDHTADATLSLTTNVDQYKKFLRAVTTLAGTTPTVTNAVILVGRKDYND